MIRAQNGAGQRVEFQNLSYPGVRGQTGQHFYHRVIVGTLQSRAQPPNMKTSMANLAEGQLTQPTR